MDIIEYVKSSVMLYFGRDNQNEGYAYIEKNVEWLIAFFIVYVLSAISSLISSVLNPPAGMSVTVISAIGGLVGEFFGMAIGVFIGYGILQLMFMLFGGKASFLDTVKFGLSISIFSSLIAIVVSLFLALALANTEGYTMLFVLVPLVLAFIVWTFVVSVQVFSRLHQISALRTVFAMLIPLFIVLAIILIVVIVFAAFFASMMV